ncbi:MAG: hypothetical protein ABIH00_00160 [Armatimonadota bacterium]
MNIKTAYTVIPAEYRKRFSQQELNIAEIIRIIKENYKYIPDNIKELNEKLSVLFYKTQIYKDNLESLKKSRKSFVIKDSEDKVKKIRAKITFNQIKEKEMLLKLKKEFLLWYKEQDNAEKKNLIEKLFNKKWRDMTNIKNLLKYGGIS